MEFKIGKKIIGKEYPVFIIAEMSGNHNQDIRRAYKIIDAAVSAGADAVKIQTYTPDTITIDADTAPFVVKKNKAWKGKTLYKLYGEAYTPWEWQSKLKKYSEKKGLFFFSTPFDPTAVDFLEKMGVGLYKIASFEVVDIPLLARVGKTKKPVIMSRGMATVSEIKLAIKTLRDNGCPQIALLHCVSAYPAPADAMNLTTISDLEKRFKVVAGLSDHTLFAETPVTAVALGAKIIEKHLTLKRSDGGPDSSFSLEPDEFKKLVQSVRMVEKTLGRPHYGVGKGEEESVLYRKSLFVVEDLKKGDEFTAQNTRSIRPGQGLAPKFYNKIIGRKAKADIKRGTPLSWRLISR